MTTSSSNYFRADIEGLRALAVLLVVFYHLQVPFISGGFIGVDVFFVISGFVITQLLMRSLERQQFRFRDFYARRIRRLVPIYLLVSTITFVAISPFYIGDAYYIFAKSWLSSLVGLSNIYYYQELSQYFSPSAQSLSLLHTWSLAVEEQFYLIWPLGLFLAWRFGKGKSQYSLAFFLILFILAFAVSIIMAIKTPTAAFYLLPARLFEFLLGTGVALFLPRLPTLSRAVAEILAWFALALILATGFLLSADNIFPGYNAFYPTFATALLIYIGSQQQQTSVIRLLSLPVMVFLGGLSYSLYLWHWPAIAFMHYQLIEFTWLNQVIVFVAALLCSWLGFHLVENRFRRLPWSFKRSFFTFIFFPLLVIWAIQSAIRLVPDLSFRIPESRRAVYQIIANSNTTKMYKRCFKGDFIHFDQSKACLIGKETADGKPNAVLIGDSHAIASLGMIEPMLESSDTYLLIVTQASTAFFPTPIAEKFYANDSEKRTRNIALTEYLSEHKNLTVFIGAQWSSYTQRATTFQYMIDTIDWLKAQEHQVVIIGDVAELPSADFAACLLTNRTSCAIEAKSSYAARDQFAQFKQQINQRYTDVLWVEPYPLLCDEKLCQSVLNGVPLYRDESHLNYIGAKAIGEEIIKRLGNPISNLLKKEG